MKMGLPKDGQFIILRMEELNSAQGLPAIDRNMDIYQDLHFRVHGSGNEISTPKVSTLSFDCKLE